MAELWKELGEIEAVSTVRGDNAECGGPQGGQWLSKIQVFARNRFVCMYC